MKHEDRANLKQEILDAAWELFDKNGYEKTTVNDIIKKANTSKGGFYYYFKAKEGQSILSMQNLREQPKKNITAYF